MTDTAHGVAQDLASDYAGPGTAHDPDQAHITPGEHAGSCTFLLDNDSGKFLVTVSPLGD